MHAMHLSSLNNRGATIATGSSASSRGNHFNINQSRRNSFTMGDSQEARRAVEDSQLTRLPDNYNGDPNATQRVQVSLLSSRLSSSITNGDRSSTSMPGNIQLSRSHDEVDRDSPSQLSTCSFRVGDSQFGTVPETPREFTRGSGFARGGEQEYARAAVWNCYSISNEDTNEETLLRPVLNNGRAFNRNSSAAREVLGNITNVMDEAAPSIIPEWDGCSPDLIINSMK